MTNSNTLLAFVAALLFTTISGFGQTLPTPLTPPPPPVSILPPVGLVLSETAQVNISNPAALVYNSAGAGVLCTGTLTFYNANGTAIGLATSFKIENAQILSFKLPYTSTGATDPRTIVWAAVNQIGSGGVVKSGPYATPTTPACTLASTIETYDSVTGITHAFASVPPQADPTVVRACATTNAR
jgi:hypothetical protein